MAVITNVTLGILGLAAALALVRLVRGPGLADRVVALDVVLLSLAGSIAVQAARTESDVFLLTLVVVTVIVFVSTVVIARYLEGRDPR
jgi:multisubunit Na+/H+ antiporter MnhF subunit